MLKTTYEWHSRFEDIPLSLEMLRHSLVVLAGPSGAGKTTIASALVKLDGVFEILCNCTTRPPRSSDDLQHFEYLSEQAFLDAHMEGRFFLSRLEPRPRYAYCKRQVLDLISQGKRPILMFRHAGTQYIADSLGAVPTVFIEGAAAMVASHSRNVELLPGEDAVEKTLQANRQLEKMMAWNSWPRLKVTNHYSGEAEICAIAAQIREFLSTDAD